MQRHEYMKFLSPHSLFYALIFMYLIVMFVHIFTNLFSLHLGPVKRFRSIVVVTPHFPRLSAINSNAKNDSTIAATHQNCRKFNFTQHNRLNSPLKSLTHN